MTVTLQTMPPGMTQVEIEIFKDELQRSVANMVLEIQRDEFLIPISLDEQPDLKAIPAFYQIGKGNFWTALDHREVVGTIGLLDIGNGRGALRKMFVRKEYRGKQAGVAQQLLGTLLNWAKNNNYKEILLGTTEKFTAAQRFYEKNGFREIEKSDLPGEFPVMKVDVKFYKYFIA